MTPDNPERDASPGADPLVERVRAVLERDTALEHGEAARLAEARRKAFAQRHATRRRAPAYGIAVAASLVLVAGLLLLRPGGLEPLPSQLTEVAELELLLGLEEEDAVLDPEFLAWAVEEHG
ncbi:hypothetical protein B1C78_09860 [Thioalkalivibrio denitrificans]|uniref:DUF3619 family protein n=1 Tax=Thioalkalivibrio denitrificans TaxID=108003 RepID=A0A1V3NFE1_9GAMM|nr:hypothetical protein [Thioalkalivibrio denitrificans]OOG23829.1 hypothetical protein B1C78_09860 [Thioalkalivibrio denitrificans]